MYLHYCYLLGILPKNRPSISAKQVHVLFREDLLKLNTISKETKLLCHYHIDTAEQLFSLKESLQKKTEHVWGSGSTCVIRSGQTDRKKK